jgi:hypothetical protein
MGSLGCGGYTATAWRSRGDHMSQMHVRWGPRHDAAPLQSTSVAQFARTCPCFRTSSLCGESVGHLKE